MDTSTAYAKPKASVAYTAKNAGIPDRDIGMLINNAELKRCAAVISLIETNPHEVNLNRKRANIISKGGKTVILNSSKRINYWITRRGIKNVDEIAKMISSDIKRRCKNILGDPLKQRALEVKNGRKRDE